MLASEVACARLWRREADEHLRAEPWSPLVLGREQGEQLRRQGAEVGPALRGVPVRAGAEVLHAPALVLHAALRLEHLRAEQTEALSERNLERWLHIFRAF